MMMIDINLVQNRVNMKMINFKRNLTVTFTKSFHKLCYKVTGSQFI